MKVIATFNYVRQVSPDDFSTELRHKICNPETTIGEILEWYENIFKTYYAKERPCVRFSEISLSETDESYEKRSNQQTRGGE